MDPAEKKELADSLQAVLDSYTSGQLLSAGITDVNEYIDITNTMIYKLVKHVGLLTMRVLEL